MTRDELSEYKGLVAEAEGMKRQLDFIRHKIESVGAIDYSKAPGSGAKRDIKGDLIAAYIDRQRIYERKLAIIEQKKAAIEKAIDDLPPLGRAILRSRYIENMPIWKIAQEIQYSERQTARLLSEAIAAIENRG